MINNQLIDYIKRELSLNVSKDAINTNLKSAGWNDADINEAFAAINLVTQSEPPTSPSSEIQSEKTQFYELKRPILKANKITLIIASVIVICLAGGAAFAYYSGAFISLPNLFSDSIDGARKASAVTYDTTISIDFSQAQSVFGGLSSLVPLASSSNKIVLTTKGSFDVSDEANTKNQMLMDFTGGGISFSAELRSIGDTVYATLTKAPALSFLPVAASLENKWISFPYKSDSGLAQNPLDSLTGIDSGVIDKVTDEQKENLYKMTRDANFIKMTKRLPPEVITGESSYHFLFDLNKEGIVAYLESLKEYVNSVGKNDSSLSSFDPTTFSKGLDNLRDFTGEIWIGRNSNQLRKIAINFGYNPDSNKDELVKVSLVGIFSEWNQPVQVVAPAVSMSLQDLFSSSLGEARSQGNEAQVKASLSMIRAQAEIFYDKQNMTYIGFCTSKELIEAWDDIEDSGGTGFICNTEAQVYSISVKLPEGGGYWCIDSTGTSKATSSSITGTSCSGR